LGSANGENYGHFARWPKLGIVRIVLLTRFCVMILTYLFVIDVTIQGVVIRTTYMRILILITLNSVMLKIEQLTIVVENMAE